MCRELGFAFFVIDWPQALTLKVGCETIPTVQYRFELRATGVNWKK